LIFSDVVKSMNKLRNDFVASCVIIHPETKKFLFVHHKKLGVWLPPGGHIDEGELPHEAAVREVKEETGLDVELIYGDGAVRDEIVSVPQVPLPFCILHEHIPVSKNDVEHMHVDFIYLAKLVGNPKLSENNNEIHSAQWFTISEISAMTDTFDNVRELIKSITSSKTYSLMSQ